MVLGGPRLLNYERMTKSELLPQTVNNFSVGNAAGGRFDYSTEHVIIFRVCSAPQFVKTMVDFGLVPFAFETTQLLYVSSILLRVVGVLRPRE